jgi:hypothetical protein
MKTLFVLVFTLLSVISAAAQDAAAPSATPLQRPRVVTAPTPTPVPRTPPAQPTVTPTPQTTPTPIIVGGVPPGYRTPTPTPQATPAAPRVSPTPVPYPSPSPTVYPSAANLPKGLLTMAEFRTHLAEAKRFFQTRPVQTALTENGGFLTTEIVTLAALDPKTKALHTISLPKTTFLSIGFDSYFTSSLGKLVRVRTLRANGVNTAVTIYDNMGQPLVPLVVQYPIERGGRFAEMAYYTSAHPALLSPEITRAGQLYIRTVFEAGLKRLRERGKYISPQVIAAAEDLALIEHVDHQRFLTESRSALYDEIYTLFALNEGGTYRYAVSSAGAGGLVQMIPATYRMVKSQHPTVPLTYDFVEGMRDHINAVQAMLLYMQDTWNDLSANDTIYQAVQNGIATEAELMAAGYNSNPARLPAYVRRGGANWRNLIPRETQMYLQIQRSVQTTIQKLPPIKQ